MPPATTTSASPVMIACAPSITAFRPEPHTLLIVVQGTSLGSPAKMLACRAHAATTDARCYVPGVAAQPDDQQLAGVTLDDGTGQPLKIDTVRISVRVHGAGDVTGTFLCDRVFKLPGQAPDLRIPRNGAE